MILIMKHLRQAISEKVPRGRHEATLASLNLFLLQEEKIRTSQRRFVFISSEVLDIVWR